MRMEIFIHGKHEEQEDVRYKQKTVKYTGLVKEGKPMKETVKGPKKLERAVS